jgi:hypothetical protein
MTFPSIVLTGLAERHPLTTAYEFNLVSETDGNAHVEIAYTNPKGAYSDLGDLEHDALLEFVNRNGCHNAESTEDYSARFISSYHVLGDHENIRRATVYITKNK